MLADRVAVPADRAAADRAAAAADDRAAALAAAPIAPQPSSVGETSNVRMMQVVFITGIRQELSCDTVRIANSSDQSQNVDPMFSPAREE